MPFQPMKKAQRATVDRTVRKIQEDSRIALTTNKGDARTPSSKEGKVGTSTESRFSLVKNTLDRTNRRYLR